ncbi:hypothetical protein B835_1486 [Enterococcus mundtii 3F]|nr:hypothetical protein [Enterococcus mundtii 3F]
MISARFFLFLNLRKAHSFMPINDYVYKLYDDHIFSIVINDI